MATSTLGFAHPGLRFRVGIATAQRGVGGLRVLHVHRNAVVYRIANIKETLDIDLSDPDNRFALQLACRARLMTMGGR